MRTLHSYSISVGYQQLYFHFEQDKNPSADLCKMWSVLRMGKIQYQLRAPILGVLETRAIQFLGIQPVVAM